MQTDKSMNEFVDDPLLRAKQAWQYLSIGKEFFYRLVRDGKLPKGIVFSSHCVVWKRSWLNKFANEIAAEKAAD